MFGGRPRAHFTCRLASRGDVVQPEWMDAAPPHTQGQARSIDPSFLPSSASALGCVGSATGPGLKPAAVMSWASPIMQFDHDRSIASAPWLDANKSKSINYAHSQSTYNSHLTARGTVARRWLLAALVGGFASSGRSSSIIITTGAGGPAAVVLIGIEVGRRTRQAFHTPP